MSPISEGLYDVHQWEEGLYIPQLKKVKPTWWRLCNYLYQKTPHSEKGNRPTRLKTTGKSTIIDLSLYENYNNIFVIEGGVNSTKILTRAQTLNCIRGMASLTKTQKKDTPSELTHTAKFNIWHKWEITKTNLGFICVFYFLF